jgi:hypothetical protein
MAKRNHKGNSGPIERRIRAILDDSSLTDRQRMENAVGMIASLPMQAMREEMRGKFPELKDLCRKIIKKIDDHGIM